MSPLNWCHLWVAEFQASTVFSPPALGGEGIFHFFIKHAYVKANFVSSKPYLALKKILKTGSANIYAFGIGMLTPTLLARILGPEDRGVIAPARSIERRKLTL